MNIIDILSEFNLSKTKITIKKIEDIIMILKKTKKYKVSLLL
jgi:hypothetical protein